MSENLPNLTGMTSYEVARLIRGARSMDWAAKILERYRWLVLEEYREAVHSAETMERKYAAKDPSRPNDRPVVAGTTDRPPWG